jgi:hypothetical protein
MIMQPVLAAVAPVDIPLPDAGFTVWGGGLFAFLLSPKKNIGMRLFEQGN